MKKAVLILTLLCCTAAFAQRVPVKNVAVIETQVDERSGAASEINRAEVGVITNAIRRQAVNNLPRSGFNVMTAETVQAMGAAVLEECAEENCVIALGSKIGADYIVRGMISKFRDNFTVTIEIYETEYGMLVTADEVRTANLDEILEKTVAACADMYKKFLETSGSPETPAAPTPVPPPSATTAQAPPPPPAPASNFTKEKVKAEPKPEDSRKKSPLRLTLRISTATVAAGGLIGGVAFHGRANSEYDTYTKASGPENVQEHRKNTERYATTGNVLYTVGCIGLSGFALTFFF